MVAKKSILIIDDDKVTRITMAGAMRDMGYDLTFADNGMHAIYLLEKYDFDLILSDYQLPDINGIEVIMLAKEVIRSKNVPAILLSTSDDQDMIKEGLLRGAVKFVQKPVDRSCLKEILKGYL